MNQRHSFEVETRWDDSLPEPGTRYTPACSCDWTGEETPIFDSAETEWRTRHLTERLAALGEEGA
jgi:hypothetical protein